MVNSKDRKRQPSHVTSRQDRAKHKLKNMPQHNLQDTWGMICDICREVTPVVRWCFIGGLVLGIGTYGYVMVVVASARILIRSPFWFWMFFVFLVGGGIVGLAIGAAVEGIVKLITDDKKDGKKKRPGC
jgi:hypothetical protein